MIVDSIKRFDFYVSHFPELEVARIHLMRSNFDELADGRYDLGTDQAYGLLRKYKTTPLESQQFEAHRRYIDIQYVVSGEEYLIYNDIQKLSSVVPYNETDDYELFSGTGTKLRLSAGDFVILFPQDAHIPKIAVSPEGQAVVKATVKLRI